MKFLFQKNEHFAVVISLESSLCDFPILRRPTNLVQPN